MLTNMKQYFEILLEAFEPEEKNDISSRIGTYDAINPSLLRDMDSPPELVPPLAKNHLKSS